MATLLLSAAGAAIGSGFGGTVLGLSGAVIGRAVGATLGRTIDQRILGGGSDAVEVGRVDRFRLMGASEGAAIPRVWGRVRIAGQVIWATRFQEHFTQSGGKGAPQPRTQKYYYSVSLAIALCEGAISRVGRIWADGNEIPPGSLDIRVYKGTEDQLPDPKMQAVEGAGLVPAYRGLAYIVIEDLDLSTYGNRVPQFSFEVIRPAQGSQAALQPDMSKTIKGVCLIPGTGEYALATTAVHYNLGLGMNRSANVNSSSGKTDFTTSFEQLQEELPGCNTVSIVVSWFGNDLRCANCQIKPKVEQTISDGIGMPWQVSGITRSEASVVPILAGRSVYGGSPADQAVIEAIRAIQGAGKKVTFYPFILMEQLEGNALPNPWDAATVQPALPWRGRITLDKAPGQPGTVDRTTAAATQVDQFFGQAQPVHFQDSDGTITYSGPLEWSYRRFILHYAKICAMAGAVDTFCIGSEMRSLTQIRGLDDSFPTVTKLRQLAADVRLILGPLVKISYAADWSEYFGYHIGNSVYFHLDELWADPEISFVGIDNYMPVSDWRDGEHHADAIWGDAHNVDYIRANISGGEGYDWYYDSPESEVLQIRKPIIDSEYSEPWVFRYKDFAGWWGNTHYNRIDGVRSSMSTSWVPESKPFRFTEYGCAAVDKATNEPNRFVDVKSSESGLPKFSNGQRDDAIQICYYQAQASFWSSPENNPQSYSYNSRMIDFDNSSAWAWDSRPYPDFPGNTSLWSDGDNYNKGHWINGRCSNQSVASVLSEICEYSGLNAVDTGMAYGVIRGFTVQEVVSARSALQPILLAVGIDSVEKKSQLFFKSRNGRDPIEIDVEQLAISPEIDGYLETNRTSHVETPRKIRIVFTEAERDFSLQSAESSFPDTTSDFVAQTDLPLVLTHSEGISIVERWLSEVRATKNEIRFALPRSMIALDAGDVINIGDSKFRIDRIERFDSQIVDAVMIHPNYYEVRESAVSKREWTNYLATVPVFHQFLDLPLLPGIESPYAPHIAVGSVPWMGSVGVWSSVGEENFSLNTILSSPSIIGITENELLATSSGQWDRGAALRVKINFGSFSSVGLEEVLSGSNVVAIGDGTSEFWEVFQFQQADLLSPGVFDISTRLRGQLGTDGVMPQSWPSGSTIVLLNSDVVQISLLESARGLTRNYQILPLSNSQILPSPIEAKAFNGIGLRPYSVSHLKVAKNASGNLHFEWIRRTRVDGDSWISNEVPLAEESESYIIRLMQNSIFIREEITLISAWEYSLSMQVADGYLGLLVLEVAQVSQLFDRGPFKSIEFEI